jgi:16S rRNA (guanine527-N7)-methyltransferase
VAVAELIPTGARVADVGSGAGLPGIALAIVRHDLHVTLIESLERRSAFLIEAVASLALANTTVVRARAEDLAREMAPADAFDVVTARAVAPLDKLVNWSLGLVRPGGELLAIKGARAAAEAAEHRARIATLGGRDVAVVDVGTPPVTATVVRIRRAAVRKSAKRR